MWNQKAWGLSVGKGQWHPISKASSLSAKVTKTGFPTPLFMFFELNSCQVRPGPTITISTTKARQNLANQFKSKRFVKLISLQVLFLPLYYRNIFSSRIESYFHLYPIPFYGCEILCCAGVWEQKKRSELANITLHLKIEFHYSMETK